MSGAHGHGGHGGHGHESGDRLGTYIGVTMAILGVLLAFCTALLGSERTSLLQKLVEEEHAHAKYQAQDVKHRMAFLTLSQTHALAFGNDPAKVNKADALVMAQTVERYLEESVLAAAWTKSYPAEIHLHMEAQESYEHGLLAAEIGIVIASIALMMRRRWVWAVSVALGALSLVIALSTYTHSAKEMKEAVHKIEAAQKKYDDKRVANKTTAQETRTLAELKKWATEGEGAATIQPKPAASPAPAAQPAASAHH